MRAIHLRYALPPIVPAAIKAAIKKADSVSAFHEATLLAGFSVTEASRFFGRPVIPADALPMDPMPPVAAQAAFLARFAELDTAR